MSRDMWPNARSIRIPRCPSVGSLHYARVSSFQKTMIRILIHETPKTLLRDHAAVISIFLPLTLFHSRNAAPTDDNDAIATAT